MRENVLTLLPPRVRQAIYIAYGVAVIVAGAVDAVYSHVDPTWLQAASRVLEFLAIPVTALAATHITQNQTSTPPPPTSSPVVEAPIEVDAPAPDETPDPADSTSDLGDSTSDDLPAEPVPA